MRRRVLLTGGALAWAVGARAQEGLRLQPGALAALRQALNVPGVSVAIATADGAAWAGSGVAWGDIPVRADTLFQAASISKTLTAVAALRLAEQGRLDLDRDVNDYLRAWRLPDSPLAQGQKVTARRITGHIAGLGVPGFPGYAADAALPTLVEVLDGRPPANTPPIRIVARPGRRYAYSGGGTTILQQLLIDLTGEPFPDLLHRLVIAPCGMSRSGFWQPLPAGRVEDAARAHDREGRQIAGGWHLYPELAAAGLWTTPQELLRFVGMIQRAARGEAPEFLRPETIAMMLTPQSRANCGIGFYIQRGWMRHSGGNAGFKSFLFADPRGERAAAIMANGENGERLWLALADAICDAYGWPRTGRA